VANDETEQRSTWDLYSNAWKAPSLAAKREALAASTETTCVYRDPLKEGTGHGELLEYMQAFNHQRPGAFFVTHHFQAHHRRSIARWHMVDATGAVLGEGVSYGEYAASGKLVAMTGFFDVPPGT
jgi:SnoaL-like domain